MSNLNLIEHDLIRYDKTLYYLIGIMPDNTLSYVDGSHGDPQEVAKAQELYEKINIYKDRQPVRWAMITVSPVPEITNKTKSTVNNEAISQLNKM